MSKWSIVLNKLSQKKLAKLSHEAQEQILEYLYQEIAKLESPKRFGKALTGNLKGLWRYRVDKFRIICEIQDDKLVILVIKIGKRADVYDD